MGTEPAGNPEVTVLLKAWSAGDASALEQLTNLVYGELHRIARRFMRNQRPGQTLQTTALVHEVYIRLVDVRNVEWQHRAQFFAISAQITRAIVVDAARARCAGKRGGGAPKMNLDDVPVLAPESDDFILAVDEALVEFAKVAPRQARIVELRYFGGLTEEEVAEVMKTSSRTIRRDWVFAKAWLQKELSR